VQIVPGEYHLTPKEFVDSTCGNCEDPNTAVAATYGLQVSGKGLWIQGPEDHSAVIITHSGYGLFFNHCEACDIEDLTITGGERDEDGNATDAAIVVKNSNVSIKHNQIRDNIGDSATVAENVVGIMGICGRENSTMYVFENQIMRNSWDGIALYRGASATIAFNIIDGVDKAGGKQAGGGRGVAIGVTWNAKANIEYNLVRRYWKGIGLFMDAYGRVEHNIIEDMLTWGIALWDADRGKPVGVIEDNVIYNTGACGASITSSREENPGHFIGNVIVKTAQDPRYDSPDYYCYQCALAEHAVPENFRIEGNVFYDNRRATDDLRDYDVSETEFLEAIEPICEYFSQYEVFEESDFMNVYWADD
jgi:hypothetical protein